MIDKLMAFGVYACVGISMEVFFTAFYPLFSDSIEFSWSLSGNSYVWMFLIYGSASMLFPFGFRIIGTWNIIIRILIYGIAIIGVELIAGAIIRSLVGFCPWEYQEGWHFDGLIRFDYLPLWMVFGFGLERIHRFNQKAGLSE